MKQIHIAPNKPLYVALVDPEGQYDFELRTGRYETTAGELLCLPRPAVVLLNQLAPAPGEKIQITRVWSGRPGEPPEWTVALSGQSENARAQAESEPQDHVPALAAPIEPPDTEKAAVGPPTPIRTRKKGPSPAEQPRLFDRRERDRRPGAGRAAANSHSGRWRQRAKMEPIPANIAVGVLTSIAMDPNTQN